jgi:hypothetical protein
VGAIVGASVGDVVGESVIHSPSSMSCFAEPANKKFPPPYHEQSFLSPTSSGGQ